MNGKEKGKLNLLLEGFGKKLQRFPDGRINYTGSKSAVVATIFAVHGGKILLLRRSNKVGAYKGKWNAVAGYVDDFKPIEEKILEEIREEAGITAGMINMLRIGKSYSFYDADIGRRWIVYPAVVVLKRKPVIKINWESTGYRWILPKDMGRFKTVPNLERTMKNAYM